MAIIRECSVLVLSILLIPATIFRAQGPQGKPGLAIAISAVHPIAALGSDVTITIKMTNVSTERVLFNSSYHGSIPEGYGYEIRNDHGDLVQHFGTRYRVMPNGEKFRLPDSQPGSRGQGELRPGESSETQAVLSDKFDFDHPGTYTVKIWSIPVESGPDAQSVGKVYSNTITIRLFSPDSTVSPKQ